MEKKQFIEKVGKIAAISMDKTGILASMTIAQAILESGWGTSRLTTKGNALFGIKAGANWKGRVYNAKTKECYDGKNFVDITAAFRAYNSWEESIEDHARLLSTASRYKALIGEKDYKKACTEIKKAGYATDPGYSQKLINLIEEHELTYFDNKNGAVDNKNQGNDNKTTQIGGGKMKVSTFIEKLNNIATNYKTKYAWGCFGCPLTEAIVNSNAKQYPNQYSLAKRNELITAGKSGAFGFDCVNLIKGIAWGWNGDKTKTWGGANYATNGVPDITADQMISKCSEVSTNFSNIVPGEAVWLPGHIGVYVGGGVVIEATPKWENGVQKSAIENIGKVAGLPSRRWSKHGKLPFIVYDGVKVDTEQNQKEDNKPKNSKSITEVAKEVLDGKWGNGAERKERLTKAGYNYNTVQAEVNKLSSDKSPAPSKKSVTEIAKEVIAGEWGNGNDRKAKLQAAGYNYNEVQAAVNNILRG